MPESRADQAHRTLEEISNYHDCGDARGRAWLDSHPDARERPATGQQGPYVADSDKGSGNGT